METRQDTTSTLTFALLTEPARVAICRALLAAGDDGMAATDLAAAAGLSLARAVRHFQELMQADVVALNIRDRRVCYVLKSRPMVREALEFVASSGLND